MLRVVYYVCNEKQRNKGERNDDLRENLQSP